MLRKEHWENIYKCKQPNEVGWYEAHPEMSLRLVKSTGVGIDGSIIDVGGGASSLSDVLIKDGYQKITVLDISAAALQRAKERLGELSNRVTWLEGDITEAKLPDNYDIWHDRAVFHFLTDADDRKKYVDTLRESLNTGGYAIIATFSIEGPMKCSGLDVVRYSPETLHSELGDDFKFLESINVEHVTPSKFVQKFIF
ncbi:MAG: class I SAM-dependent methyltransferase [Nitrospirae bacterium]|nr:class I SAM-dependent methyltransferase [Nitrospirota bacterium]MBF0533965.1 class I SAM-dependent methyltransferase [Nitrospirota bacterium]MBF0616124.1 class I SAM-dependent methyltransferase [Nitrospirota bacterium]